MPNSGFISTLSPSVKTKLFLRSFLHVNTIAICCAATDSTGKSIRLNSSKQPQEPDWARPSKKRATKYLSRMLVILFSWAPLLRKKKNSVETLGKGKARIYKFSKIYKPFLDTTWLDLCFFYQYLQGFPVPLYPKKIPVINLWKYDRILIAYFSD